MSDIKWIKVAVDMFEDSKIEFIRSLPEGDAIIVTWIQMLSIAGQSNMGGYLMVAEGIPYTEQLLSNKLRRQPVLLQFALETLTKLKMIDIEDGPYHISKWEKHQNVEGMEKVRLQTKERVIKHRMKERNKLETLQSNATVTLHVTHGNATELELDLELEKESTTGDFESLEKTHLRIFGGNIMAPMWMNYYHNIRSKGYTDPFIRELILEASETSKSGVSQRFVDAIFERWSAEGIYSRQDAKRRKEETVSGKSTIGRTGQAARYVDPAIESRREEIARNKWIEEGNDPSGFKYQPASGD